MNSGFSEILEECLRLMESGAGVEACLARFPEHADDLRPYLQTIAELRTVGVPAPSHAAFECGRRALLERVAQGSQPVTIGGEHMNLLNPLNWLRAPVLYKVGAAAAALVLLAGAGIGASAAAGGGNPLSGVLNVLQISDDEDAVAGEADSEADAQADEDIVTDGGEADQGETMQPPGAAVSGQVNGCGYFNTGLNDDGTARTRYQVFCDGLHVIVNHEDIEPWISQNGPTDDLYEAARVILESPRGTVDEDALAAALETAQAYIDGLNGDEAVESFNFFGSLAALNRLQGSNGPPEGAPQGPPEGIPQGPPEGAPQGPPEGAPQGPPEGAPQGAPEGTPQGPPTVGVQP